MVSDEVLKALEWAVRELEEWDAYQRRPERGDYGVECACCMGEMFDAADRDKLASAREALAAAKVKA